MNHNSFKWLFLQQIIYIHNLINYMASIITIDYEWFLNCSIRLIDETLTGTIVLGQSGPGSNMQWRGDTTLSISPELNPHYRMQFSIILPFWCGGLFILYREYSQSIRRVAWFRECCNFQSPFQMIDGFLGSEFTCNVFLFIQILDISAIILKC